MDVDPRTTTLGKAPATPFHVAVGGNKNTVLDNDRFDVMTGASVVEHAIQRRTNKRSVV
jgi:hypothetical protein